MQLRVKIVLSLWFLLFSNGIQAQITQTIRGVVRDIETQQSLPGARLMLYKDTVFIQGVVSDDEGRYRFSAIEVGRYALRVRYTGYTEWLVSNLLLNSGKELIVPVEMEEAYGQVEEIVISGNSDSETFNEMSVNSARAFNIEETERYAGTRSDAARMASNFAGVSGSDDSRNDISVRGNSPLGLLWRIEGIDILNPNHFAVPGSTGGAISILNNKLFGNSDFFTGAFPAEYGNATAGVFDIHLRNGNTEKHEYSGQFGVLGTELAGEGPLSSKGKSSYLFAYRYSTLKIFESLKIPIGTSAVPGYQDFSFKLNFSLKSWGNLSVWGVSGHSTINIKLSDKPVDEVNIYSESDWDQKFRTGMYVGGVTHTVSLGTRSFLKTSIAQYGGQALGNHHRFVRDSDLSIIRYYHKVYFNYRTSKSSIHSSFTHKFNARSSLKAGIMTERIHLNYLDSNYIEPLDIWEYRNYYNRDMYLIQPYAQWKIKAGKNVVWVGGLHGQYLSLNNNVALEPRTGLKWNLHKRHSLSFSSGMHSQMLPLYIYAAQKINPDGMYYRPNQNTNFSRSLHNVIGYDFRITDKIFIRIESYYQHQYKIPVDTFSSAFSMLNQGTSFTRFFPNSLENTGTGSNYGIEFTLNRSFANSFYYLLTATLYESNYRGKDGIQRPTDMNGRYILNGVLGKEFRIGTRGNKTLLTGLKAIRSGGRRYTPADALASDFLRELVEIDSLRNSLQFRDYFRVDIKIGYRINRPKVTHEIAIDIINVLNRKNILGLAYVPDPTRPGIDPFREEYQLGLLPLFWYRLDF